MNDIFALVVWLGYLALWFAFWVLLPIAGIAFLWRVIFG